MDNTKPTSSIEFGSMPLDPIYAWSIVLEPVETLIEHTSGFIEQLAKETCERGEACGDEELERRFLAFFDRLVEKGTLTRLPDASPEMGRQILVHVGVNPSPVRCWARALVE